MATKTDRRSRYFELLVLQIRRLLREHPSMTRDELDRALKTARGAAGGHAKAERGKPEQVAAEDGADVDSFEELIADVQEALQRTFGDDAWSVATYPVSVVYYHGCPTRPDLDDDPDSAISSADAAWEEATENGGPDGDGDADDVDTFYRAQYTRDSNEIIAFGEQTEVEKDVTYVSEADEPADDDEGDCYEEQIDAVEDALSAAYGNRVRLVATYPAYIVYCLGDDDYWRQAYTVEDDAVVLGEKASVEREINWEEVAAEDAVALAFVPGVKGVNPFAKGGAAAAGTGAPVPLPPAIKKLPPPVQAKWRKAYAAAFKKCGGGTGCAAKAVQAANAAIKAPASVAATDDATYATALQMAIDAGHSLDDARCIVEIARAKLAYEWADAEARSRWGDAFDKPAGMPPNLVLSDGEHADTPLPKRLRAVDWNNRGFTSVALRLDAAAGTLPRWQQLHKIGTWAIPHASGQKILLTREMGNRLIENFKRGVVRRGVPLDERHFTDSGGHALGWLEEMRWGSEGQGLPDAPEPDGSGPILYGAFRYNDLGEHKLRNEHYKHISPQYFIDYPDAESGNRYGPALVAVATTNNPYLRVRDLQGNAAPEPVAVLEDGLIGPGEMQAMPDDVKVSLESRLETMQARLDAAEAETKRERKERHKLGVETYLDKEIHKGLPPALAALARPILLASSPDADAVISLSADAATPTHNLHDAFKAFIAEVPRVEVATVHTYQSDTRPYKPSDEVAALDDQVIVDFVSALKKNAGFDDPARIDGILASTASGDDR